MIYIGYRMHWSHQTPYSMQWIDRREFYLTQTRSEYYNRFISFFYLCMWFIFIAMSCLLIFHLMFSIKMEFNTFFNTKRQTLLFIWCALNASTEKNQQNHWAFIKNALMENVVEGEKICSIQMNMTRTWNNNKN